jgi:hypothetical protein
MVVDPRRTCRPLALLLALALALPLWASPAVAKKKKQDAPQGSRIYGKIHEADGRAGRAGVIVHAYHLATGKTYSSEPSAKDGSFDIPGLPIGYFEIVVETDDGAFVGEQIVGTSPAGKALVLLRLLSYDDQPDSFWATHERREVPGSEDPASGLAALLRKKRGAEFWKSPKGVAIMVGAGTGALLLLVSSSDDDPDASPFIP